MTTNPRPVGFLFDPAAPRPSFPPALPGFVGGPRLSVACRRTADALRAWLLDALSPARVVWKDPLGYSLLEEGLATAHAHWATGEPERVSRAKNLVAELVLRTPAAPGRSYAEPYGAWAALIAALDGKPATVPAPLPPPPPRRAIAETTEGKDSDLPRRVRTSGAPRISDEPCLVPDCEGFRRWRPYTRRLDVLLHTCSHKCALRLASKKRGLIRREGQW